MSDDLIISQPFSAYAPFHQKILDELEAALGLDRQFTARRELAECLLELLQKEFSAPPQIDAILTKHKNAMQSVLATESGDVPKSKNNFGKHPLEGEFGSYEIPAFFLTSAKKQFRNQLTVIKFLILMPVILFAVPKYTAICRRARVALSKPLPPSKLLDIIPSSISFDDLQGLESSLIKLQDSEKGTLDASLAKDLCIVIKSFRNASVIKITEQPNTIQNHLTPDAAEWVKTEQVPEHPEILLQHKSNGKADSKAWIINCQKLTANDYRRFLDSERKSLIDDLYAGLLSTDRNLKTAAAIVLTSLVTGQEVDEVINLVYGAEGNFNLNGEYCREIKIPEGAYVPQNHIDLLRPRAKYINLMLPTVLKKWLANLPVKNQRLIDCLNMNIADLKIDIERLLGNLKKQATLNRIHQQKISAALHIELMLLYRDETLCHILASRPNQLPPANATYICHELAFLQCAYSSAVTKLFVGTKLEQEYENDKLNFEYTDQQFVSGIYPNKQLIKSLPKNALKKLNTSKCNNDIVNIHNSYVDYCLALLMTATGHRPVSDPFSKLSHIDLENNLMIICDKVMYKKTAWRVVGIPEIATLQIKYYQQYLKALPSKLESSGYSEIANKVEHFNQGAEDLLPLFFYLNHNNQKNVVRITQGRLSARWAEIWTLPVNYTRHIVGTELMKLTTSGEVVKIQLGHNFGSSDHFGTCSTIAPQTFFSGLSASLNKILKEALWQPVKSPIRSTTPFHADKLCIHYKNWVFGHDIREKDRKNKHEKTLGVIRNIAEQLFGKTKMSNLALHDVKKITSYIEKQDHESREKEMKELHRLQRNGSIPADSREDKSGTITRMTEASPFNESSIRECKNAQKVRVNWFEYLALNRNNKNVVYEMRLAEITISAALCGNLHSVEMLQSLHLALPKFLVKLNHQLLINFLEFSDTKNLQRIWYPDSVSRGLILSLMKIANGKLKKANPQKFESCLKQLMKAVFANSNLTELSHFDCLFAHGRALSTFELPGFLRDYASGVYKSASLSLHTLVRTDKNMVLDDDSVSDNYENNIEKAYWESSPYNDNSQGAEHFKKRLRAHKKKIEQPNPLANQDVNKRKKKQLYDLLSLDLLNDSNLRFDNKLITEFTISMILNGTLEKTDPAYNTIIDYTEIIINLFINCTAETAFYNKNTDEIEWEFVYITALDSVGHKKLSKVCTVFYQFHRFLNIKYGVREIDWSPIYTAVGQNYQDIYINANFVSLTEYLRMLDALIGNESFSEIKRYQLALVLMFGYRFGTRIDEALGALARDVIDDIGITLIIKNNYERKTKTDAGRRIIILNSELTSTEKRIFQHYMRYARDNFFCDSSSLFFPDSTATNREVVNKTEFSAILNELIKNITGDKKISFQQLRHSYISADVEKRVNSPSHYDFERIDKEFFNKNFYHLDEIATSAGHTNAKTTLVNYTHCLDRLTLKWQPNFEHHLTDRAIAYILSLDYNSIRKKRARNKIESLLSLQSNKLLSNLIANPNVKLRRPIADTPIRLPKNLQDLLSLTAFANIVFAYAKSGMTLNNFIHYRCEPSLKPENIIDSLCEFERDCGYDIFQLNNRKFDSDGNIIFSIAETQRVDALEILNKKSMHKYINRRHSNGLANDIEIWVKTYHPPTHTNLINDEYEFERLKMLLVNYCENPDVCVFFAAQNVAFAVDIAGKRSEPAFKKVPSANEKLPALQAKKAQLKIKNLRQRNSSLMIIFILGSYIRYLNKNNEKN